MPPENQKSPRLRTIQMPPENNASGTIMQSLISIDILRDQKSPPLETQMPASCNKSDTADDDGEDTSMPPPLPYYGRDVWPVGPTKLRRTKSDTTLQRVYLAKDSLASRQFNRSMPNLLCSLVQQYRLMGSTGDFRVDLTEKLRLPERVEEFDTFIADL